MQAELTTAVDAAEGVLSGEGMNRGLPVASSGVVAAKMAGGIPWSRPPMLGPVPRPASDETVGFANRPTASLSNPRTETKQCARF